MITFKDLESLKQYLRKDSQRVSLNPVRFINVDSLTTWIEVKQYLLSLADETMPLSGFCEGKDTTPNINRVNAALKKVKKPQLITPLSEYLRIIPEQAEPIIQKFIKADYQNNETGKLRIYFLMYRMKSLLRTIPSDDPRAKDCILLFETDEESDYRLTIVQKDLDISLPGNEIHGFRSYLEYWEANPDKPLILHTGNAIHFEKNHFFDDVQVIVSSYDLIKFQFRLPSGLYEELGTDEQWNELARVIIKEGSFENACRQVLSTNRYRTDLFRSWNRFDPFQKWILWLWTRQQIEQGYATEAARACESFGGFVDELYCRIIAHLGDDKIYATYKERKGILSLMQTVPTDRFWREISTLSRADALSCLTCLTDIEKKTVFEILSDYTFENRNSVLPILKSVYPQLYYYLQNDKQPNKASLSSIHEQYFREYRWLKATDSITEAFVEKVKQFAIEKGASVFELQPRNHYVTEHYEDGTAILFVDGMGIEYVDYLAHLFSDLDEHQYAVTIEAGSCNLPSITELNKDFMNGRRTLDPPVRELDELKHANNTHPESLIKQLNILDSLKDRVLGALVGATRRVIITADHGTSRMAVKARNTAYDNAIPKPENVSIYKYGRFCEGTEDEPKYPTAINYNDRLIFADYSRFIQNGAPVDEIHGGASLEEWIVPIITVERYSGNKKTSIIVRPQKTKYKPELGTKQIKVLFTISGERRDSVCARINGITAKCSYENGVYSFIYIPSKTDGVVIVKVVDNGILGQFEIEIEQGIKKNVNFDI